MRARVLQKVKKQVMGVFGTERGGGLSGIHFQLQAVAGIHRKSIPLALKDDFAEHF